MPPSRPRSVFILLLLAATTASTGLIAGDKTKHRERPQDVELDQTDALQRLQRSEFKPLSEAIAAAQKVVAGDVVRVKVKLVRERLAYEFKIITARGLVREVYVDPTSLDILKIE